MKKAILFIITLWTDLLGEDRTKFFISCVLDAADDEDGLQKLYDEIFDIYVLLACEKFEEQHGKLTDEQKEIWMIEEEQNWTKKFRDLAYI